MVVDLIFCSSKVIRFLRICSFFHNVSCIMFVERFVSNLPLQLYYSINIIIYYFYTFLHCHLFYVHVCTSIFLYRNEKHHIYLLGVREHILNVQSFYVSLSKHAGEEQWNEFQCLVVRHFHQKRYFLFLKVFPRLAFSFLVYISNDKCSR